MQLRRSYDDYQLAGKLRIVWVLATISMAFAGTVLLSCQASAQGSFTSGIINIDFTFPLVGINQPYVGAAAIGSPGDYWNGINAQYLPILNGLKDNSGNVTTVGFFDDSGFGAYAAPGFGGTYAALFDAGIGSTTAQMSGLNPNTQYDLYFYSGYLTPVSINVNGTLFSFNGAMNPASTLIPGAGYQEQLVTTDGTGDLNITAASGYYSGLQLTPAITPEPSTLDLLGLGVATLFAFRRRK